MGDPSQGVKTRSSYKNIYEYVAFLSQLEPKNAKEALNDDHWIISMQEELNLFERSKVWNLVPRPNDHFIIGTKWIFRNKMDEHSNIVRNKARLVAQGIVKKIGRAHV